MSGIATFDARERAIVRRAYARQMLAAAGVADDPALEAAFARVPRERFLGPPPWQILRFAGHASPPTADPVVTYQDVLFALSPGRGVNNGSPTLHARWLHHAGLRPGARVAHLGAGTGYYTALIAHLVGPTGQVVAVEYEDRLAGMACENLADLPQVTVVEGDATDWPREPVDCIYVNFSVERPVPAWLDRLKAGGRLIVPLGVPRPAGGPASGPAGGPGKGRHAFHGAGLRVERRAPDLFSVLWLGPAFFVCAEGGEGRVTGSEAEREALRAAFQRGGVEFVRALHWRRPPSERTWFSGSGWSLSYDEPA